jgi:hypothetical protein
MDEDYQRTRYLNILEDITLNELLVNLINYIHTYNWIDVVKYCSEKDGKRKYVCRDRKVWYERDGALWKKTTTPDMQAEFDEIFHGLDIIKERAKFLKDIKSVKRIHRLQEDLGNPPTRNAVYRLWFKRFQDDKFEP